MAEVAFLASAKVDFDTAFDRYAARSESAALRFIEEVHKCLNRVAIATDGSCGGC